MCNGLAIIAVETGDGWDVYAEKGNSHHDYLLSKYAPETVDSHDVALRYELLYPFQLCIDLPDRQGIDALVGHGTIARKPTDIGRIPQPSTEATSAVLAYLSAHPELLEFSPGMLAKANLRSANLRLASLYSANLRSANLRSADLRSADLRSANLYSANLESANLESANLRSANLRSANLRSADLYSADLYSADLYSANLESADLRSADLRSANLESADLRNIVYSAITVEGLKAAFHVAEALLSDDLKKILGL